MTSENDRIERGTASFGRSVALILLLALALRLVPFFLTLDYQPRYDETRYLKIAENLAAGEGFGLNAVRASRPPLYPFFLYGIQRIFGEGMIAIRLGQIAISLVIVWAAMILGRRVGDLRTGVYAGLAVAVYPEFVAFPILAFSENLYVPFLIIALALLVSPGGSVPHRSIVAAGCFLGLSALSRSIALPITLFLAGGMFVSGIRRGRLPIFRVALLLATTLLVILPWTIRNYRVLGSFVLIDSDSALTLYSGNNPYIPDWFAEGPATRRAVPEGEQFWRDNLPPPGVGPEGMRHAFFRKLTLQYWKEHPGMAVRKSVLKLAKYIGEGSTGIRQVFADEEKLAVLPAWLTILNVFTVMVSMLAFTGAAVALVANRAWKSEGKALLFAFLLVNLIVHTLVYANARYRVPILPVLFILSVRVLLCRRSVWNVFRRQTGGWVLVACLWGLGILSLVVR
ncbi:MAG: glycosyltransferase family 39 protein [Candidatus Eisenbacteria bacterium]